MTGAMFDFGITDTWAAHRSEAFGDGRGWLRTRPLPDGWHVRLRGCWIVTIYEGEPWEWTEPPPPVTLDAFTE